MGTMRVGSELTIGEQTKRCSSKRQWGHDVTKMWVVQEQESEQTRQVDGYPEFRVLSHRRELEFLQGHHRWDSR